MYLKFKSIVQLLQRYNLCFGTWLNPVYNMIRYHTRDYFLIECALWNIIQWSAASTLEFVNLFASNTYQKIMQSLVDHCALKDVLKIAWVLGKEKVLRWKMTLLHIRWLKVAVKMTFPTSWWNWSDFLLKS